MVLDIYHLHSRYSSAALYSGYETVQKKCIFCNEKHSANRCLKITDTHARKRFLSSNGLCFVCFDKNHLASACKANYSCNKCKGRHHISICKFSKPRSNPPQDVPQYNQPSTPSQPPIKQPQVTSNNFSSNKNNVLLQTAEANVLNLYQNNTAKSFILFDSGAQRTYITKELKEKLNLLPFKQEKIAIKVFGSAESKIQNIDVVKFMVIGTRKNVYVEALVIQTFRSNLYNQYSSSTISNNYPHLKNLKLAQKSNDTYVKIGILVGLDYYYNFIFGKVIQGKQNEPIALESTLEWIIS